MRVKASVLKAVAIAAVSPFMIGSLDQFSNFEERLLAAHNRERTALGVPELEWDPQLAADAKEWAREIIKLGYLEHYPDDPDDPDPQGENLWAGTTRYYGIESMVGLWIDEKANFKPGLFPANTTTGNLNDVAHYTQLMWRSTGKVGCAVARGHQDDFLVCRYSEGGNVIGETPF